MNTQVNSQPALPVRSRLCPLLSALLLGGAALLLSLSAARAQTKPAAPAPAKVYTYVEQMPMYKDGGMEGLQKFVARNLRWPQGTQGRVFVGYVIDTNGRVLDVKVLKGLSPALDAEAVRVVKLLDGQYQPGKQNGQRVAVNFTLPIPMAAPQVSSMLPLPILNVHLHACAEDWQQMTPAPRGRHCAQCDKVVVDFTQGTQAELQAARAAATDGQLCGRFRTAQLAPD